MREIKFRAYDTAAAAFIYSDQIAGGIWRYFKTLEDRGIRHFESQQFTGLKDRNGKEIYEGDLIKDSNSDFVGEVIWDAETLCFTTKFKDNDLWGFVPRNGKDNHCEVIGNISAAIDALMGVKNEPKV